MRYELLNLSVSILYAVNFEDKAETYAALMISQLEGMIFFILIPLLPDIANFRTKYFIPSKVYNDEGGIK